MFDVFYIGKKPGLFGHERAAENMQHAQSLSRTRYCWIVTYLADYQGFDFLWEPVPWQKDFVHVWPSPWHKFGGTYLVPKHLSDLRYHFNNKVIPNRSRPGEFRLLVEPADFDFAWAPHPQDPPYIYVFGNQWWSAEKMPTVEYPVSGATERKFMAEPRATLGDNLADHWHQLEPCEWDRSWRPDPGDPPYIYVFGNQWWPAETWPTLGAAQSCC